MTSSIFILLIVSYMSIALGGKLYSGPFQSSSWVTDISKESIVESRKLRNIYTDINRNVKTDVNSLDIKTLENEAKKTTFTVALNHRNIDKLKTEFLAVSMPKSGKYGKHLSIEDIRTKYSPKISDLNKLVLFFEKIKGSLVTLNLIGE